MRAIPVTNSILAVRKAVAVARMSGLRIGCVPTMGALHEGHASLIRSAKAVSDFVVTTIFVNPSQFGPNEDFTKYPRTLEADCETCAAAGADLVFAPTAEEMYPPNAFAFVDVGTLGEHLCGPLRPGHFRGVCTIVMKLFQIVQPGVAVFGAKDAQQTRIIRKMILDLNVPVQLMIAPTIRERDGLAMSSRNRYLTPIERSRAPEIYRTLCEVRDRALHGERDVARLESALRGMLEAIPESRLDYAAIVDDETMQPLARIDGTALLAVAIYLGKTRLIDNVTIYQTTTI
jgi:pantoate--beta-alanine ligase